MKNIISEIEELMHDLEVKIEVILNLNNLDVEEQIDRLDKGELIKDLLKNSNKKEMKYAIKYIENHKTSDYLKCTYISDIACGLDKQTKPKLIKSLVKKAIKYADIAQMYGIAGGYYQKTGDKEYAIKLYKKAIKKCLKTGNTSRLHLLGQHMIGIDRLDGEYFMTWGEDIKVAAKKLSDEHKQKVNNMMKIYKYEKHEISYTQLNKSGFLEQAKYFFETDAELRDGEIYFVIKADMDEKQKVDAIGAYYGMDMPPFTFLVNSNEYSSEVFFAEAESKEAMLNHISNKECDNLYIIKAIYKDFKLLSVECLYSASDELSCLMFNYKDDEAQGYGEILKQFGKDEYSPKLNFFLSEGE